MLAKPLAGSMTAEFMRMFAALQEQTKLSFWRSDVLRPLHILFLALATVTVALTYAKAPDPLIYGAGAILGLVALTEIGAFIYCLLRDPDLLRSERIRMQKMAMEARLIGDEQSGLFDASEEPAPLPSQRSTQKVLMTRKPVERSASAQQRAPRKGSNGDA